MLFSSNIFSDSERSGQYSEPLWVLSVDSFYGLEIYLSVARCPDAEIVMITKEANIEPHLQGGGLCLGMLLPGGDVPCPHCLLGFGRPGPEQLLVQAYQ